MVEACYSFFFCFLYFHPVLSAATGSSPVTLVYLRNLRIRRLGYAFSRSRHLSRLLSKLYCESHLTSLSLHSPSCLCPPMSHRITFYHFTYIHYAIPYPPQPVE
ncbi:hypothetical protein BC827DRAFT_517392 [Russula dissimulans]|nr:hypothetical protein BC827DRAFT_517392 [Russula dissimulans]